MSAQNQDQLRLRSESSELSQTKSTDVHVNGTRRTRIIDAQASHPAPTVHHKRRQVPRDTNRDPPIDNISLGPFDVESEDSMAAAEQDGRFVELYHAADENAPRDCDGRALQWMTIAEAAKCLRIRKSVLSNLATRGDICSIKPGGGNNTHRLVHLDNILAFIQSSILRDSSDAEEILDS